MALQEAFTNNYFPGFTEAVPGYASLAVFYDLPTVLKYHPKEVTAFDFVKAYTETLIAQLSPVVRAGDQQIISVPVLYNGDDLGYISGLHQISVETIIDVHTQPVYRVYMIGFLPGFAYMGTVDKRIATPRKTTPRVLIPAGSIGIAGFQTGIYPFSSPGGWQLIGQTPLKIFDKAKTNPCLFNAGDKIKFTAISRDEFDHLNEY